MKRSRLFFLALCLLLALGAVSGFAQSLAVTANTTVVDGVVNAGEYSFTKAYGPLTLSASRTDGTLFLALTGTTSGWVALGLGSQKMNGATIFMGFVGDDGKVQFKPQYGSGHSHKDAAAAIISYAIKEAGGHSHKDAAAAIISYAIKEAGGTTTIEIALDAKEYLKGNALDLIMAMGADKSFVSYHSYRNAVSLKLG